MKVDVGPGVMIIRAVADGTEAKILLDPNECVQLGVALIQGASAAAQMQQQVEAKRTMSALGNGVIKHK